MSIRGTNNMPILEKETYEKFGYYPSDLKPKSCKKILAACEDCGKIRESRKDDYAPLCKSCAQKGKNNPAWKGGKIKRICKQCGKGFETTPSQIKKGGGKFCSQKCLSEWKSEHIKGKNNPAWQGGEIKQICQTCGCEFTVTPSIIKIGKGKFCSQKCWGIWSSEHRCGENATNWKGGEVKRICEVCGKKFEVKPYMVKRGHGKYCSTKCSRKYRKIPKHHTKPELIFEQICKKNNLPFKYTGDGSFWIGKNPSINPDFVECNGKKIAIEIFSYWHDPLLRHCKIPYSQTYEGRKKILKKYGWALVVFWQEDLERKDAEAFVLNELQKGGIIKEK